MPDCICEQVTMVIWGFIEARCCVWGHASCGNDNAEGGQNGTKHYLETPELTGRVRCKLFRQVRKNRCTEKGTRLDFSSEQVSASDSRKLLILRESGIHNITESYLYSAD